MTPKAFRALVTADIHRLVRYYEQEYIKEQAMFNLKQWRLWMDTDYYDRAERAEMEREIRWEQARARRVCPECLVMGGHNAGCPAAPEDDEDCDEQD